MTRKTHIAVGLAATLPLLSLCPKISIIGIVASTLPDIDIILKIKHRTITHSLLALLVSTVVVMALNFSIGVIFGLNYLIHLILDSFTNMGIPLLYPYLKKRYGPRLILTGGIEDICICLAAIFVITTVLWK